MRPAPAARPPSSSRRRQSRLTVVPQSARAAATLPASSCPRSSGAARRLGRAPGPRGQMHNPIIIFHRPPHFFAAFLGPLRVFVPVHMSALALFRLTPSRRTHAHCFSHSSGRTACYPIPVLALLLSLLLSSLPSPAQASEVCFAFILFWLLAVCMLLAGSNDSRCRGKS